MQHLATVPAEALKRRQVSISANNDNTNRTVGIVLGVLLGVFLAIAAAVAAVTIGDQAPKAPSHHPKARRRRLLLHLLHLLPMLLLLLLPRDAGAFQLRAQSVLLYV
ncbi:hypothetical protein HYQ45_003736 [Verticillium longisporum]|uniref:Uncharacterized protein n=1 Tax=Verticillium longisporum TaxID=100787 RepID=A0A8I2ZUD0_VERLO|nr:hypothetical protein HYQ45_003736 [Verticillium longisporum]